MGYIISQAHSRGSLEDRDGDEVWRWRFEYICWVAAVVVGVVERVLGSEGDGFGFDEVGEFEDDGLVVQVRQVGRRRR